MFHNTNDVIKNTAQLSSSLPTLFYSMDRLQRELQNHLNCQLENNVYCLLCIYLHLRDGIITFIGTRRINKCTECLRTIKEPYNEKSVLCRLKRLFTEWNLQRFSKRFTFQ